MSDLLTGETPICQNCHAIENVERHQPWCEKSPQQVQEAYLNDFLSDGGSNSLWMCKPCGSAVYDTEQHVRYCPAGQREWEKLDG